MALIVLVVGVVAIATLAAHCMNTNRQSKYVSLAAQLASEKLEDLSRWDPGDPQVCVPAGSQSVGSLTSDVLQTTTCPPPLSQCTQPTGASYTVNYFDDVYLGTVNSTDCPNTTYGCFSETVSAPGSGTAISTITHAPDGTINVTTPPTMPTPTFHRRWIIEADSPVPGDKRDLPAWDAPRDGSGNPERSARAASNVSNEHGAPIEG